MKRILKAFAMVLVGLLVSSVIADGAGTVWAQSDEVLYVVPGSRLTWGGIAPERAQSRSLGTLGEMGNHIAIGDWLGAGRRQLAVVARNSSTNKIVWRLASEAGEVLEEEFGDAGDTVVAAADFDGNGIDDPTVITPSGRALVWTVSYDLFRNRTYRMSYALGFKGEYPFFIKRGGTHASLASLVVGKTGTQVRLLDPITGTSEVIRGLPRLASGSAPIPAPFQNAKGEAVVAVSRKRAGSTTLMFLNLSRRTMSRTVIKADGDLVVGDFLADAGDEYAVSSATGIIVGNPSTRRQVTVALPQGAILVDAVNINQFSPSSGAVPTATPTPQHDISLQTPLPTPPPNVAPPASLSSVCAQSAAISPGEMLIKSDPSDHIHAGDARTTGYTVVCGRLCPQNRGYVPFYYSDGTEAGAVAQYGTFRGNGKPRLYGAVGKAPQHFASEIARRAATIGNGKLYIQMSASTQGSETWCKEFNPSGRNGGL